MQPQQVMQQRWDSCQKEAGQADRQQDRQTHRQACGHVDKHTKKLVYSFKRQTIKMQSSSIAFDGSVGCARHCCWTTSKHKCFSDVSCLSFLSRQANVCKCMQTDRQTGKQTQAETQTPKGPADLSVMRGVRGCLSSEFKRKSPNTCRQTDRQAGRHTHAKTQTPQGAC